jgi:hypothetical protein
MIINVKAWGLIRKVKIRAHVNKAMNKKQIIRIPKIETLPMSALFKVSRGGFGFSSPMKYIMIEISIRGGRIIMMRRIQKNELVRKKYGRELNTKNISIRLIIKNTQPFRFGSFSSLRSGAPFPLNGFPKSFMEKMDLSSISFSFIFLLDIRFLIFYIISCFILN